MSDNKLLDNRGSRLPALHPILDIVLQNNIPQDCYNKEIRENITKKTILHRIVTIKKSAKISQKISDNKLRY
jgi:hypothetical protein